MSTSDAFALRRSGLNEFLFASVGTEANGMVLSLVSVFARQGNDPWLEAGRLDRLPKSEATESLAQIIAGMPASTWPLPASMAIAARLIGLLPSQSGGARQSPPASAPDAKAGRLVRIWVVLACVACVAAFEAGVFTTVNAPKPDGGSVASFAAPPR
jgi:hypothetical protein